MAEGVNICGKVDVKIQLINSAGNLKKLGEAMDMVDVEERAFWQQVPGDRYGGPQGPPIEILWLGAICVVRMELSRWDPDVWDLLKKRQVQATAGTILLTEVGSLMLTTRRFRLCLASTTRPLNFPSAVLRDSYQFAMGSKFSGLALQFECHRCSDGGARDTILYNTDTVEYAA